MSSKDALANKFQHVVPDTTVTHVSSDSLFHMETCMSVPLPDFVQFDHAHCTSVMRFRLAMMDKQVQYVYVRVL